jgi:hypothetical protein
VTASLVRVACNPMRKCAICISSRTVTGLISRCVFVMKIVAFQIDIEAKYGSGSGSGGQKIDRIGNGNFGDIQARELESLDLEYEFAFQFGIPEFARQNPGGSNATVGCDG